MRSTTERLEHDLDLVAVGASTGVLWRGEGFVLAGAGESLRLPIDRRSRAQGAQRAQESLARLTGRDDVNLAGSGPIAFAAMPFDPDAAGELVVPQVVLVDSSEAGSWVTVVGDAGFSPSEGLKLASAALTPATAATSATTIELTSSLPPELWRDEIVAVARDRIRGGQLTKAVLARELTLTADAPLDIAAIVSRLADLHETATVFALDGFVGASPELLVSRNAEAVGAHPLAGTAPRASSLPADKAAIAALLASTKDRWEHQITIEWLLDELLAFCSYVDAEPEPTIVSLPNVHHLGTKVQGRLASPPPSVLELVAALHPTPAVGGDPQEPALQLIAQLEQAERGRYAGPTGWVDGQGNGAFCVAIRSAQISGAKASLFAGVGVVGDSDPESELAETRAKFQAMLAALAPGGLSSVSAP